MIMVRYGYRFTPQRPENAHKAGEGECKRVFSTVERAHELFTSWHAQAPSWDYWFIDSREATKTEIRHSARYRLTRT